LVIQNGVIGPISRYCSQRSPSHVGESCPFI
jgi:hypothetical protein